MTFICQQLSQKLYQSSLKHSQSPYSSEFKLRRYLFFKTQQEGLSFQLEKRDPLAAMLGISTRQLNRALAHLVSIKAITLKNKSITVLNCECLSYIDNSNE
ncbi:MULTISPECIES: winged helix-turn-helix domain-containing protein [Proteus]|uniref:winged helix-turn-helix domain-containing protein n=1 Tax=Proteus TaxID=583 RepID=UPI000689E008|nr:MULTISPECIES: winged helix-turn-helix domain-containing protein [Proteus]MBG2976058.1 winged helix-turn-helix domain-containing protein [Proteus mirabilis]MBG3094068.1 winged helix-turn-helix domain-containing protein [Proteus mirabilis]MBI6215545.1 winged helix-turn-helix domain-containing protein [Proteus vulgaris]MBI6404636.1 winged helix-turn-helix domain-containing protein [Proteus sp. PR00208]MBI6544922.1 winged helix-turn-helix domain-containing protein [Proteus vulgaris]